MLALSSAWLWLSAIARLKAEHDRLQQRIHGMYVDSWTDESMASSSAGCRQNGVEQARCIQDIERHTTADQSGPAASARRRLFTVSTSLATATILAGLRSRL